MIVKLKEPKSSQVVSVYEGLDVRYKWMRVGLRVRSAYLHTPKLATENQAAMSEVGTVEMDKRYLGDEIIVPYGNIMYVIMDGDSDTDEDAGE